jgi:hypothetical protein
MYNFYLQYFFCYDVNSTKKYIFCHAVKTISRRFTLLTIQVIQCNIYAIHLQFGIKINRKSKTAKDLLECLSSMIFRRAYHLYSHWQPKYYCIRYSISELVLFYSSQKLPLTTTYTRKETKLAQHTA